LKSFDLVVWPPRITLSTCSIAAIHYPPQKFLRHRAKFFGMLAEVSQQTAPFFPAAVGDLQLNVRAIWK
jgi:hypothetical protein